MHTFISTHTRNQTKEYFLEGTTWFMLGLSGRKQGRQAKFFLGHSHDNAIIVATGSAAGVGNDFEIVS